MTTQTQTRSPRLLADLPEYPLWIGDWVKVEPRWLCTSQGSTLPSPPQDEEVHGWVLPVGSDLLDPERITEHGKFCRFGGTRLAPINKPNDMYSPYMELPPDYWFYALSNRIVLVKRGPLWHFFHGKNFPFHFLAEALEFFSHLGAIEGVQNPKTDNYTWPLEQAIEQIKMGKAHLLHQHERFFPGSGGESFLGRFQDNDLGKPFRDATLRKYGYL